MNEEEANEYEDYEDDFIQSSQKDPSRGNPSHL